MYKVLIVDDEMLMRTSLKVMLDWEDSEFKICGEAINGEEAIGKINNIKPDIIVSDIKMPKMDGTQLCKYINKNNIDSQVIILSNYDDFNYVKSAFTFGAMDYILKHNLNKDTLLEALERAREKIDKSKNEKKEYLLYPTNSTSNLLALREKFIIQILTGIYKQKDEIKEHLKLLDINLDVNNVIAIVAIIDDYKLTNSQNEFKDIKLIEFAVINIAQEILTDFGKGIITHIANEKFIILISFSNYRSSSQIDSILNQLLERISQCLKQFMNISISLSIGKMCPSIESIVESYQDAERNLCDKFFYGNNCILKNDTNSYEKFFVSNLDIETEKRIVSCIKQQKLDELLLQLETLFTNIKVQKIDFTSSQIIFGDLLSIINRISRENDISLSSIYNSDEAPYAILAKIETLAETKKWFFDLFERLYDFLMVDNENLSSYYVKKTLTYVKIHYCEDISLSTIAEKLNISNTYLSTLFKKEVGTGFAEYLIQFRIEKVKALMQEGHNDIKEIISNCGFNNYDYFFKLFKRKTGMTPKEYINLLR